MASYDFDCVAQQGERVDCVDLIGHKSSTLPGAAITSVSVRHIKLDFLPSAAWTNVALTAPSGAGFPAFVRCASWALQRLDCFASGAGLSATHMLHASLSLQVVRLNVPSRQPH
jgi:hypothetical protein